MLTAAQAATNLLLTGKELYDLTGYARCADQARWLKSEGIRYRINGKRKVVVIRSDLDRSAPRITEPRLAAVR